MAIKDLEEKILSEAKAEAEQILKAAQAEAKKLMDSAQSQASVIKDQIFTLGQKDAEKAKKSIVTPARLEAKKMILEEKRAILDKVFEGMPKNTREDKEIEVAKFIYG